MAEPNNTGAMKALRMHRFHEPFRLDEAPIPEIGPGEVLIRVLRAGLNYGDVHMRDNVQRHAPEQVEPLLPLIIGHDGLGEVVEAASDVENVQVRDRVVVMCSLTCGFCKYCRTEREHLCRSYKVMGFLTRPQTRQNGGPSFVRYKDGLLAEYCRVPARNLVRLRPEDDVEQIARVSQIAVGYRALKRVRFGPGETLLVNGASGITGTGVVLSGLAMGAARIIVVARNAARLEQLRVIDPARIATVALGKGEIIAEKVRDLTDGNGCEVLVDLVPSGTETTMECLKTLEPGGRVAFLGGNAEPLTINYNFLMTRSVEFTSFRGRMYADIPELMDLARRGVIDTRHITTRHFPLERINEAYEFTKLRGDEGPIWPMYALGAK